MEKMNIQQYLKPDVFLNILEVLPEQLLRSILNGYSFALHSGTLLIYIKEPPTVIENLDYMDALEKDAERTFNPVCKYWRGKEGCNKSENCRNEDKKIAMKYLSGEWSEFTLYRCKPLNMWDMSYPLKLKNKIFGVLFGGQIIVNEGRVNWEKALHGIEAKVDWSTLEKTDNHAKTIISYVESLDLNDTMKRGLLRIFEDELHRESGKLTVQELRNRVLDFKRFGEIIQNLINELYEAHKTTVGHQLARNFDTSISSLSMSDSSKWWEECQNILDEIQLYTDVEIIQLFIRERSHYRRELPIRGDEEPTTYIKTRDCIQAFPRSTLVRLSEIDQCDVLRDIGIPGNNIWGYRLDTGNESAICSTLLFLDGEITDGNRSFIRELCTTICIDVNIASLFFRERETDKNYKKNVGWIGHSFRTPLQALQFAFEDIKEAHYDPAEHDLLDIAEKGMKRIIDAKENLFLLLESATKENESINLVEVLNDAIQKMEIIAEKHPCLLKREDEWPENIPIFGNRNKILEALKCLLDNAIKYSYIGKDHEGNITSEVRIRIEKQDGHVKILISNFGIGIPPEILSAIGEYGLRGKVKDRKRHRLGNGLGLPFSMEVFAEHQGWIHVRSEPSKYAKPEDIQAYHRYITDVEVALPIFRR